MKCTAGWKTIRYQKYRNIRRIQTQRAPLSVLPVVQNIAPVWGVLEPSVRTTQARLKSFGLVALLESNAIKVILDGVLEGGDFLLKEI